MKTVEGFKRGINLGGWMSQCDYSRERLDNFITEKDIEKIASWGLDHVRLPIDYHVVQNVDGAPIEEGFARIDRALSWCRKYHLKIVLDLHKTRGFSFDSQEQEDGFFESEQLQELFYRLWEEFSRRYGNDTENILFELLNEITDHSYIDAWNRISCACIRRIRQIAPDIRILVGSYHNNSAPAVAELAAPYDEKVIYNFHSYDPLEFTHQGAYWMGEGFDQNVRLRFEDCQATEEYFENRFAPALDKARQHGTALYCGEYGVIDQVTPEDALKWIRTIHKVFEKYQISRCIWSYKEMDFGLSDARMDGVRDEILKNL